MKNRFYRIFAAMLVMSLFVTSCGSDTTETDTTEDTPVVEGESADATETEDNSETETETEPKASFTDYQKLTALEDGCFYDAETGLLVASFSEENVRYTADDDCTVGISGNGDAYSISGTLDPTAYPDFVNGDYYTGVAVKPSEELPEGKYLFVINFGMYTISFRTTVG